MTTRTGHLAIVALLGGLAISGCSSATASDSAWLPVADVVDGDTIKVDRGGQLVTVRLIGIDTPETVHPSKPVECFGPEASARMGELLSGASVRLERDQTQDATDAYGRELAYVWLQDGRLVNELMIRDGYGTEYTYDDPYRYQDRFVDAQRTAQSDNAGLWGECV